MNDQGTTWQHQYLLFTLLLQYPFPLSLSLIHTVTESMALRLPTQLATPGKFLHHHHHHHSKINLVLMAISVNCEKERPLPEGNNMISVQF